MGKNVSHCRPMFKFATESDCAIYFMKMVKEPLYDQPSSMLRLISTKTKAGSPRTIWYTDQSVSALLGGRLH